jgi:predicted nucleotidyltransferase
VDRAVRDWAAVEKLKHPELHRLGYFGSYARGDWGVGSDLDLIALVDRAPQTFDQRSLSWDLSGLPVPAEVLVYTLEEWEHLASSYGLFARTLQRETTWIFPNSNAGSGPATG